MKRSRLSHKPTVFIDDEWTDEDNEKIYKSARAKRSRSKGLGFERDIANVFKEVFKDSRRQLEFQKAEAVGVDLKNCGEYLVQCKAYKNYAPISCIEEIVLRKGFKPVLITKGDRLRPVAVLYFDDFMELVKRLEGGTRDGA